MKRFALIALALVALTGRTAVAVPPAAAMYADALEREQAVRAELVSEAASLTTLRDVRAALSAYEALVRAYPASGYSDNALWQAGCLALDAFDRFGDTQDRERGLRLLQRLAAGYPTSRLVSQVPEQIARAGG